MFDPSPPLKRADVLNGRPLKRYQMLRKKDYRVFEDVFYLINSETTFWELYQTGIYDLF